MSSAPTRAVAAAVSIRGLHHFAYRCRDCEETRHFYEDLLGLPLVHAMRSEQRPGGDRTIPCVQLFFALADGTCIAFFDVADAGPEEPTQHPGRACAHLAMLVDSTLALEAAKMRLQGAGVDVAGPIDRPTTRSIGFLDPNGIRVELTVPTVPDAEIGALAAQARCEVARWTVLHPRGPGPHADRSATGVDTVGSSSPELSKL